MKHHFSYDDQRSLRNPVLFLLSPLNVPTVTDMRLFSGQLALNTIAAGVYLGLSWDDAKITSVSRQNCNLVSMIKQNQKVFSILGTGSAVAELAQKLVEYEMGDVVLYVGENPLPIPDEKIFQATPVN